MLDLKIIAHYFKVAILIVSSLSSCKKAHDEVSSDLAIAIELNLGSHSSQQVWSSDYFESFSYTSLESSEESFIGKPAQVDLIGGEFFILDVITHSVKVFAKTGEFKYQINIDIPEFGHLIEIGGFEVNGSENSVCVHIRNQGGRILQYSNNCELINEILEPTGMVVQYQENRIYHYYPKFLLPFNDFHSIKVVDLEKGTTELLFPMKTIDTNILKNSVVVNYGMYTFLDTISFWDGFSNSVFRIASDNQISKAYNIVYDVKSVPSHLINDRSKFKNKFHDYPFLFRIIEAKNYMFFEVGYKRKINRFIYDKRKNSAIVLSNGNKNSMINDIDVGLPFWPDGILSDGRLFMYIEAKELRNHLDKMEEDELSTTTDNMLKGLIIPSIFENPIICIPKFINND